MSKLTRHPIKDPQRRTKAETIMGEAEAERQKRRAIAARISAAKKGESVAKAEGREAIKRVGEYRKAKGKKAKGMKAGGKVCKGMGAATHGGNWNG